jgi:hypothetical protein
MTQNMPEAACNSYDELDKRITLSYTHENTVSVVEVGLQQRTCSNENENK